MQLIEAALAFAITMLVLSLVVSSFVELIHRFFSMREEGLKHMLGQLFDQVLVKHLVKAEVDKKRTAAEKSQNAEPSDAERALARAAIDKKNADTKTAFVEQMRANRAPMGARRKTVPGDTAEQVGQQPRQKWPVSVHLWNGRDLAAMTPAEFMERLGSHDVGKTVAEVNAVANKAAGTAADATDAVLKDVAQKFEAFGKEASAYFEGRARLLSVTVAVALAFLAHVDAVDLFKTYLRDPNARAKVIEQSGAVTAQHMAAVEAAKALKALDATSAETADEIKTHVGALKDDWKAAITAAKGTVKQYADLGVPIGWTDERMAAAGMKPLLWTCKDPATMESLGWKTRGHECNDGHGEKSAQHMDVWIQVPMKLSTWFYLFLGGLLIGLGAPFWYRAVTGLTDLRKGTRGALSVGTPSRAAAGGEATKAQPVTPVGAFHVSKLAHH
jgi:hypothetical protein